MPVCNLNYTNDKGIHGDEEMYDNKLLLRCGNKLLSSTQWEISVQRLPDWERLSVDQGVS